MPQMNIQDSQLTSPKQAILQVIAAIPAGKVCSYGAVAKRAGVPNHARYVGTILKQLPHGSSIPWHRVVNSKGFIAFPEGSERWLVQRERLAQEGVKVNDQQPNFRRYFWNA